MRKKKELRCHCGVLLQGREKVQCRDCCLRNSPGSVQCPWNNCLQWYIAHGGNSYAKEREYHFTRACGKMTYEDYCKKRRAS